MLHIIVVPQPAGGLAAVVVVQIHQGAPFIKEGPWEFSLPDQLFQGHLDLLVEVINAPANGKGQHLRQYQPHTVFFHCGLDLSGEGIGPEDRAGPCQLEVVVKFRQHFPQLLTEPLHLTGKFVKLLIDSLFRTGEQRLHHLKAVADLPGTVVQALRHLFPQGLCKVLLHGHSPSFSAA